MIKLFAFLILIIPTDCSKSQQVNKDLELVNTKWIQTISDDFDNYIIFNNDSSYIYYDCEIDQKYYGIYSIEEHKVILHQRSGEYDSDFSDESIHRASKLDIELIFDNNKLYYNKENEIERSIPPFEKTYN